MTDPGIGEPAPLFSEDERSDIRGRLKASVPLGWYRGRDNGMRYDIHVTRDDSVIDVFALEHRTADVAGDFVLYQSAFTHEEFPDVDLINSKIRIAEAHQGQGLVFPLLLVATAMLEGTDVVHCERFGPKAVERGIAGWYLHLGYAPVPSTRKPAAEHGELYRIFPAI